jgi:DNA (cytosine-5)-methyltransferase 1
VFIQADALDVLSNVDYVRGFAAVHASPPCQHASALKARAPDKVYPALIEPTRERLQAAGRPWVIENVMPAALDKTRSIVLCGEMFRLRTYRHRRFESSVPLVAPHHPRHVHRTATTYRAQRWAAGWHISVTGDPGTWFGPEAMGIDWMTGQEMSQAVPPAYTRCVGIQLMRAGS